MAAAVKGQPLLTNTSVLMKSLWTPLVSLVVSMSSWPVHPEGAVEFCTSTVPMLGTGSLWNAGSRDTNELVTDADCGRRAEQKLSVQGKLVRGPRERSIKGKKMFDSR